MQFLTNKLNISHSFATDAAKADAYSPFARHIDDIENKRSRLFPDRLRIPGRKTKYIVAIAYLIHFYALMKLIHAKKVIEIRDEEQRQLLRKAAPYFQSIEDIQYTIVKHRWDLLTKEVLGEDFLKQKHVHNDKIGWNDPHKPYYGWSRKGDSRYISSVGDRFGWNWWHGYEIQNI